MSRVWRVVDVETTYVKQAASPRKLHAEAHGIHVLAPALDVAVPTILNTVNDPPLLHLTEVPGVVGANAPAVFQAAGHALQRLQTSGIRCDDELPLDAALQRRFESWNRRAERWLSGTDAALRDRANAAWAVRPPIALARVPAHRDYSPRNWLWHGSTLGVIDFEHAGYDHPFIDLMRVWEQFGLSSERGKTFLRAAGWDDVETHQDWPTVALLHAFCTLVWAREHDDRRYAEQGRAALTALLPG